jgi:hypothetical protein
MADLTRHRLNRLAYENKLDLNALSVRKARPSALLTGGLFP